MTEPLTSVYIITAGSYSDYHIVAVFATEAEAAAWVGLYTEEYEIEEWKLGGERITPVGMAAYHVYMLQDGTAEIVICDPDDEERAQTSQTTIYTHPGAWDYQHPAAPPKPEPTNLLTYMFARDKDHAIKIANERRAYLIATDRWVDGDHTAAIAGTTQEQP